MQQTNTKKHPKNLNTWEFEMNHMNLRAEYHQGEWSWGIHQKFDFLDHLSRLGK